MPRTGGVVIESGVEEGSIAFENFYRQQFSGMARLGVVMTGNPSLGEDLAQEAFVRVQPRFTQLDAPLAYTRKVLINLCKRPSNRNWTAASAGEHPAVERDETATVELLDAVDRLPHRQRAVIVLRYYEDLSEAEIAQVLDCRPGTVKSLSSRALTRLRKDIRP